MSILDLTDDKLSIEMERILFDISINVDACYMCINELLEIMDEIETNTSGYEKTKFDTMQYLAYRSITEVKREIDYFVQPNSNVVNEYYEDFIKKMTKSKQIKK